MSIQNMNENMDIIQSLVIPGIDFDMDIIQKLDDEPNDVGGLTAAELKAEFDKAGNLIKSYINETLLPAISDTVAEEDERSKAEETRIANEQNRVSAENLRVQAENARATSEEQRAQAEAARASAEQAREQAESKRVTAEQSRVSAETARVSAEQKRASAESDRVSAEQERERAEAERESATSGIVAQATEQANFAAQSANAASESETRASNYAKNASNSASQSMSYADSSQMSSIAAAQSASAAKSSETNAKTSETNSASYKSSASASASAAKTSETNAKASETAAKNHMDAAQTAQQAIENMTVSVKTLAPGSTATATKTTAGGVVNIEYGIPRGEQGQGLTIYGYYSTIGELEAAIPSPKEGAAYGVGVIEPYDIYVWDSIHSTWKNNGPIQGPAGPQGENGLDGKAATVRVGSVTTGEPGSQASVSNGGTESDAVFNFTIPRGADGRDGAEGPAGADGKSAYQSAKEQGYTGTEAEFYAALVSLKDGPFLPLSGGVNVTGKTEFSGGIRTSSVETRLIESISGPLYINGYSETFLQEYEDTAGTYLFKVTYIADPINERDAANKKYVDGLVGNISTVLDTINGEVV